MSRKKSSSKDDKIEVPAYIVTFSDMITLLLTFFVLLLAMATEQKKELFNAGQNAFKRSLAGFGISGSLFGSHGGIDFNHQKAKYRVDEGQDEPEDRSIDFEMEMIRRKILELERTMKILPSQISGTSKTFTATDIHFKRGNWGLDASAKQFLKNYCMQLSESMGTSGGTFYVVGLAGSESSDRLKWEVSARRAEEVAGFIRKQAEEGSNWLVYSWGAGPGGDWAGPEGVVSKNTDIMIVSLTAGR
ncbi:MAG: flagellar motor protein MotB [Planctomycetota bacterium]|jgi:chemotaxis protein MotB